MRHNEYDIGAAFKAIEDELIKSMIRNMKNHRVEEAENEKQWEMWQAKQLESLERYKKKNRKKYKGQFESINDSIDKIIRQAYEEGGLEQEIEILEAIKKRHGDNLPNNIRRMKDRLTEKLPFGNQVGKDFFQTNDKRLDALVHATTSDMQTAETAMLRMADDQYRKIIFNAQTYAISGAGTYEKAVDMATKNFLAAGINCIEYKGGRRVNIKSYAEMVVRTSSKRAQLYADGQTRKEIGISTVIAKKRLNACPLCLPFVNKVLIDDVWSGGKQSDGPYPLVSEALKAGFFHPNCKDHLSTYIPGVTEPPEGSFTEQEIENIGIKSKKEAEQQYVSRQVEKYERLSEHSLSPENMTMYKAKEKDWKRRLAKYQDSGIIKTDGWPDAAIERRRLDEASIAGHKNEYGILYDSQGNRILKKRGEKDRIVYTDEETALMPGGVLTHNHPNGATFSVDDIDMMGRTGITELRAIGRDGVYVIRQPAEWPEEINSFEKLEKEYSEIQLSLQNEMHEEVLSGRITTDNDYSIEYQRRILDKLTSKYGFTYFMEGK